MCVVSTETCRTFECGKVDDDGKRLIRVTKDQQVALYVHNDTQSLHVHAVIGAINLETGKKMHGNWHEYRERLVKITDKVVKSHGLAVTVPQKRPEKLSMAEIKMKARGQMTWRELPSPLHTIHGPGQHTRWWWFRRRLRT